MPHSVSILVMQVSLICCLPAPFHNKHVVFTGKMQLRYGVCTYSLFDCLFVSISLSLSYSLPYRQSLKKE